MVQPLFRLLFWLFRRLLPFSGWPLETRLHEHDPLAPSLCRGLPRYYEPFRPFGRFPTPTLAVLRLSLSVSIGPEGSHVPHNRRVTEFMPP